MSRLPAALVCALSFPAVAPAQDECRSWSSVFARPGFGHEVHVTHEYGGELYAGGYFNFADGVKTHHVARWDGARWKPVGLGVGTWPIAALPLFQDRVTAMAVYDDGNGPGLYVGGHFDTAGGAPAPHVARWDGTSWSALIGSDGAQLSSNSYVEALAVYDGGAGPELIVGGGITFTNGLTSFLARWDGTDWHAFPKHPTGQVHALLDFDDGGGSKLYVGGDFNKVAQLTTGPVAVWDGVAWASLPSEPPLTGRVRVLIEHDVGAGTALHAAGFVKAGGANSALAIYEGGAWTAYGAISGSTSLGDVEAAAVFDDGTGPALYLGGDFFRVDSVNAQGIVRWDGLGGWSALPIEPRGFPHVLSLRAYDDGSGARLWVGGQLEEIGPLGGPELLNVGHLATWDGSNWAAAGNAVGGPNDAVFDLEFFDDGSGGGLQLYAFGKFRKAGALAAERAARWDGASWSALGVGTDATIRAAEVFDDGSGAKLYAGGNFANAGGAPAAHVARWDGAQWSAVGSGLSAVVHAMIAFDDGSGPALYAGGALPGGVERWDGSSWTGVGAGLPAKVVDFAVHDGGGGPRLYAACSTFAGGEVHEWDGAAWSLIGTMDLGVEALASFDDGGGTQLYAGGNFNQVGGLNVNHTARWNGAWSPVGPGVGNSVREMFVFDDGGGPRLVAIGVLAPVYALAWDGAAWTPFQGGVDASARASAVNGSEVYIGGGLEHVDKNGRLMPSFRIARFGPDTGCEPQNYCTAGTTSGGCNALVSAAGYASSSLSTGFFVDTTGVPGGKQGLSYFGLAGKKATPWGAGTSWSCVKGPHQRLPVQSSGGTTGGCDGGFALDFNAWMNQNPTKAPAAGTSVYLQTWFRDPPAPKTTSFSDAVWFVVSP